MRDHSIVNNGCFLWIARWRCRCYTVIKKQASPLCIFKDNTDVANFISTTKIVKAKTRDWRFIWVG